MPDVKKFSLIKPTLQTPFHIDFEWWHSNDTNWHVGLQSLLCPEHQEAFAGLPEGQMIDWVDPETAGATVGWHPEHAHRPLRTTTRFP